jgi:hypothetical protein
MSKSMRRSVGCCLLAMVIFATSSQLSSPAYGDSAEPTKPTGQMLLIVGSAGAPEFGDRFTTWADNWRNIAKQANIKLTEIGTADSSDSPDFERLRNKLAEQASSKINDEPLWLVLIGHGTFKTGFAKFNLQGPDVSAEQLKSWLEPIKQPLVIVNVSAASGPFVNSLSGDHRVIVTATRSGEEKNFAHFGAYLPKALADISADLDHDDEISLLEAVLKASADTDDFYASDDRIRTEHAMIDDNGDQRGTPADRLKSVFREADEAVAKTKAGEPNATLDGEMEAKVILLPAANAPTLTPDEIDARDKIERELSNLRREKVNLAEDEYYKKLEEKMLELSRIYDAAENRAKMPASSP